MRRSDDGLIRDLAPLDHNHADRMPIHRHVELDMLARHFAASRFTRSHAWIAGPPGSGKTLMARQILSLHATSASVVCAYVNCWESRSLHAVLDSLAVQIRMLRAERNSSQFKLQRLRQHLRGRHLLVVLDEVDRLAARERDTVVHALADGLAALICISSSRVALVELDDHVRSRLNPLLVQLHGYTSSQLASILHDRAIQALMPGSWDEHLLLHIASLADGDARSAIDTLKCAARLAETAGTRRIERSHVERAWVDVGALQAQYLVNKLTQHQQIMLRVVLRRGPLDSSAAQRTYRTECQALRLAPIAPRTFSKYLAHLIELGLIQSERPTTWPSVRLLSASGRLRQNDS